MHMYLLSLRWIYFKTQISLGVQHHSNPLFSLAILLIPLDQCDLGHTLYGVRSGLYIHSEAWQAISCLEEEVSKPVEHKLTNPPPCIFLVGPVLYANIDLDSLDPLIYLNAASSTALLVTAHNRRRSHSALFLSSCGRSGFPIHLLYSPQRLFLVKLNRTGRTLGQAHGFGIGPI